MLFEMKDYNKDDPTLYLMAEDEAGNVRNVLDGNGNPIPIRTKGSYFYLNDPSSPRLKTFNISGQDIQVRIENEVKNTAGDKYTFTISANKSTDNKFVRSVDFEVFSGDRPKNLAFDPEIPEVDPFPGEPILGYSYADNDINPNQIQNVGRLTEDFANIRRFYGVDNIAKSGTLTNSYIFAGNNKHYFTGMTLNKNSTLTIPAGQLVFVDYINLSGGGQPGSTVLKVDGILIVNEFNISGNINYQINGAIIVNKLVVSSNGLTIGTTAGVDPGGSGGGYEAPSREITEEDYTWSTKLENVTDMRTDRE